MSMPRCFAGRWVVEVNRLSALASATVVVILVSLPGTSSAQAPEQGSSPGQADSRLLFGPTAETLPRGQGYLGVFGLMLPFVQVGVTDNVMVGGGAPVPLLLGPGLSGGMPFMLSAKVRVWHAPRTSIAGGVIHLGQPSGDGTGLAYVVATHRHAAGATTFGGGCAYVTTGKGVPCRLVLSAGARGDINHRVSVLTDNYVLVGEGALVSGGVRIGGTNFATDLGLGVAISGGLLPVASINFSYHFGGR